MLQSHDKIEECIKFAEMMERYDVMIVQYINLREYSKALRKVTEINDIKKRTDTMLMFASIFVNKCT